MSEPTGPEPSEQQQPASPETPTTDAAAEPPVDIAKASEPAQPEPGGGVPDAPPIWTSGEPGAVPLPPPPPPRGRSRAWWIIAAGAAALLVLVAVCCGAGVLFLIDKARPSPTDVVRTYLEATRDQDAAKLDKVTCDDLRTTGKGLNEFDSDGASENREFFKGLTWKIGADHEVTGDRHEVDADVNLRAGDAPARGLKLTFLVVKEDGWKVCGLTD
jgi:hypothetical protein